MPLLTYFTVPEVTTTLQGASNWFNPILTDFLPWAWIAIGVTVGFAGLAWLVKLFGRALS